MDSMVSNRSIQAPRGVVADSRGSKSTHAQRWTGCNSSKQPKICSVGRRSYSCFIIDTIFAKRLTNHLHRTAIRPSMKRWVRSASPEYDSSYCINPWSSSFASVGSVTFGSERGRRGPYGWTWPLELNTCVQGRCPRPRSTHQTQRCLATQALEAPTTGYKH